MPISIVMADRNQLVCESIAKMLTDTRDFQVVGKTSTTETLLNLVRRLKPSVVVGDLSDPELNGLEVAELIREISPTTRLILLSNYTDEVYTQNMLRAGIAGLITKTSKTVELIRAIREGQIGRPYFSPDVREVVANLRPYINDTGMNKHAILSPREREILKLIAEGQSSKEIATNLKIKQATVKTYRNRIREKLAINDIAGLTRHAIRLRLVSVD